MKIAAIFCVALFAYAVVASDDSEKGGTAGEEAGTKQYYMDNRYRYPQGYYRPQPTPYRPRPTRRRNNIFSNPLYLIIILSILRSSVTTAPPDTATTPTTVTTVITATTVTTATTVATTTGQYSGWTPVDGTNCVYLFVLEATKTATAAKTDCVDRGGAIASVGFANDNAANRKKIVDTLNAPSVSFWVGTTGTAPVGAYGAPTATKWLNPDVAIDASITVQTRDGSTDPTEVCGRFSSSDVTTLQYEACDNNAFYYICEYCGSIA